MKSRPGNVVRRAIPATAGSGLFRGALTTAASNGIIGGTHDALEIFGPAVGALHFHAILAADRKEFKKLVALQAFKLINRHLDILEKSFEIQITLLDSTLSSDKAATVTYPGGSRGHDQGSWG
jgi:hypothetical protein